MALPPLELFSLEEEAAYCQAAFSFAQMLCLRFAVNRPPDQNVLKSGTPQSGSARLRRGPNHVLRVGVQHHSKTFVRPRCGMFSDL